MEASLESTLQSISLDEVRQHIISQNFPKAFERSQQPSVQTASNLVAGAPIATTIRTRICSSAVYPLLPNTVKELTQNLVPFTSPSTSSSVVDSFEARLLHLKLHFLDARIADALALLESEKILAQAQALVSSAHDSSPRLLKLMADACVIYGA